MPVNPCSSFRRMKFHTHQIACLTSPVELVFFISVQEVKFERSLLDGHIHRQRHYRNTDAVFAERRIEAGLIKVKHSAVQKTVQSRRGRAIQMNRYDSHPSALRRNFDEFAVEGDDRFRM